MEKQKLKIGPKTIISQGEEVYIVLNLEYKNNYFSITHDIYNTKDKNNKCYGFISGGCIDYKELKETFPEYAHLLKWHLYDYTNHFSYMSNTVYFAGDKDFNGLRKGEARLFSTYIQFSNSPLYKVDASFANFIEQNKGKLEFKPFKTADPNYKEDPTEGSLQYSRFKYTIEGYNGYDYYRAPFKVKREATEFCKALNTLNFEIVKVPIAFSVGKERNLDSARSSAIWFDATDKDLTAPGLKERLDARIPKLQKDFKKDMEAIGFKVE